MEIVSRFSNLFSGRTDFIGAEEGGCIRLWADDHPDGVHAWGMQHIYRGHLTGTRPPLGIYPVVANTLVYDEMPGPARKQFMVKFGAIDVDVEDFPLTRNLWLALQALDLSPHVERSRSKGYHVWVFSEEWVPAVLMRSALQVACDIVHYNPKEIYPKQTELADGSPGNYIRLPYPGALSGQVSETGKRTMLDVAERTAPSIDLETWVSLAWDSRVSRHQLEQAASLAAPPKPKHRPAVLGSGATPTAEVEALVPKMGGLSYTIWKDGPLEGADRSGSLFKLAWNLYDDGLNGEEVFILLKDADERWGKFSGRADGEDRLWEIVEKVIG